MIDIKLRTGRVENAEAMTIILREIGWSQKRNVLPLEEVSNPIAELTPHCLKTAKGIHCSWRWMRMTRLLGS
ncbi:MAG TPA: hypothetical protein VNN20_10615 [Thermodesulfobacteriota bacterium]|nr:hypothetical protein [Thermodesulfobacteriota bacterium]